MMLSHLLNDGIIKMIKTCMNISSVKFLVVFYFFFIFTWWGRGLDFIIEEEESYLG